MPRERVKILDLSTGDTFELPVVIYGAGDTEVALDGAEEVGEDIIIKDISEIPRKKVKTKKSAGQIEADRAEAKRLGKSEDGAPILASMPEALFDKIYTSDITGSRNKEKVTWTLDKTKFPAYWDIQ